MYTTLLRCIFQRRAVDSGLTKRLYDSAASIVTNVSDRLGMYDMYTHMGVYGPESLTYLMIEDMRTETFAKIRLGDKESGRTPMNAYGGDDDTPIEFIRIQVDTTTDKEKLDESFDMIEIMITQALLAIYETLQLTPSSAMHLIADYRVDFE